MNFKFKPKGVCSMEIKLDIADNDIINKIEKKALSKKDKIEKAEFWGLFFFVGVPLPGTGGWTGALIASLIDMDRKKAFLAIACGVLLAGLIVGSLSFGLLKGITG